MFRFLKAAEGVSGHDKDGQPALGLCGSPKGTLFPSVSLEAKLLQRAIVSRQT